MAKDRLRKDAEEIHNLSDLFEARAEHTSTDALEEDMELPENLDVDDALTFPHPKHKHPEDDPDIKERLDEANMDEDWADQDILPQDYGEGYDELITTYAGDDADEVMEERKHLLAGVPMEEITEEPTIDVMPDKFTPEE